MEEAMSDNAPTPRTDAAEFAIQVDPGHWKYAVTIDFARTLERELQQAQANVIEMRNERKESDTKWAAQMEQAQAEAARWQWAKPVLSAEEDPETQAKLLTLGAGLMQGRDIDNVIDAAIAEAKEPRNG